LAPRWTVRGEYQHLDFEDKVADAVVHCCGGDSNIKFHYAFSAELARVGLNYHRDWGKGPIVAKD
jgi:hypothetical protein